MGSGMVNPRHVSCLGNSNHAGAGRALLPIRTLFRCRSAQEIVRYLALAPSGSLALADEIAEGEDVPEPDEVDASGAVDGGTLNFYITNPVGIEPFDTQETQGSQVATNLFDTLVTWDWGNQTVAPLAAESWEVNDDATVYTFHLRQDATFHNGLPVTSHDFKYSWERICRADFDPSLSTQGYKVEQIAGATEMMNGEADELSGVECPDDYTLIVTLRAPYGDFLLDMTDISSAPIPQGMGGPGDDYQSFRLAPVGNGPFMMRPVGRRPVHPARAL